MEKRIFLFLTFTALIAGGLSGQSNFISAEVNTGFTIEGNYAFGADIRYERVFTRYVTLGGYAYFNVGTSSSAYVGGLGLNMGIAIAGRWYPAGRKFFMELGLGGGFYIDTYEAFEYTSSSYKTVTKTDTYGGFGIIPGLGWTIDPGKPGRLFFSPGLKVPINITSNGVLVSFVIFFGLGYAW